MTNGDYRQVVGYEKYYLVSRDGDIVALRNKNGKKKLKPYIDKDGYQRVRLYGDNKSIWIGVHKIVAMAFLDNPYGYEMVNHKNFVRNDNRVENLEWCNAEGNVKWSKPHYKGHGHRPIMAISDSGEEMVFPSLSEASRVTKTSTSNICRCCRGRSLKAGGYIWKYITE